MQNKIRALTEKIYKEGIDKAQQEAVQIIDVANKKAEEIIGRAQEREQDIVDGAQKQAEKMKMNSESELRLAAQQFISNLKQEIAKLVVSKQTEGVISESFKDDAFIKDIILALIKNWNPHKPEELNIKLLLPVTDQEKLMDYFNTKGKNLLDAGLEIDFETNVKNGFRIEPKEGGYYISFTDADFEKYFKHYLKDKTKKLLFE